MAYNSGMSSGALRFLLFCRVVATEMGTVPKERAGTVLWCGSRGPACVDWGFGDRCPKTQIRVRFASEGMADQIYNPEGSS